MRKLDLYVAKYGPESGRALYHALQSQAGHASVSARLRRKVERLKSLQSRPGDSGADPEVLPLFPEPMADEGHVEAALIADSTAAAESNAPSTMGW